MRIVIFLSLLFFQLNNIHAQNVLELTHGESGKKRIIKSGSKLLFKTKYDSSYVKGKIMQIKDSVIVIYLLDYEDGNPVADVPVKDLREIKKATNFHAAYRTVAAVMLPVGGILLGSGLTPLLRNDTFQGQPAYDKDKAQVYAYSGAGLTVLGIIPYLIKPKVYNFKNGWSVKVTRLSQD